MKRYVVETKDGPVFVGLFWARDTHGLPLDMTMQMCQDRKMLFSVPHFIRDALSAGWGQDKIRGSLKEAWTMLGLKPNDVVQLMALVEIFLK